MKTEQGYPDFEVGYRREDWPELMGWKEILTCSGRDNHRVRIIRDQYPTSFPQPVAVLSSGPVYLGAEVKKFFDSLPKIQRVTDEDVIHIHELRAQNMSVSEISLLTGISETTIRKYLRGKG